MCIYIYIVEKHKTSVSRWDSEVCGGRTGATLFLLGAQSSHFGFCLPTQCLFLCARAHQNLGGCVCAGSSLCWGKGEENICFPHPLLPCKAAPWQR